MTSPKTQATGFENIHDATLACISSFEACLSVKPLMKEGWAESRLADMNLWASGVGALARPKASLDRRLQFQPKPRLVLSNLLLTLEKFIEICRIHAMNGINADQLDVMSRYEGTSESPMDRPLVVDSESTSSSASWFMALGRDIGMASDSSSGSDTEDQSANDDYEGKLKKSMDDIDDILDQLIMLGFAIRKSGTAARLQKADKTFNPKQNADLRTYLESVLLRITAPRRQDSDYHKRVTSKDRMHTIDAFREVTVDQNHLIIANLRRRHRFNYARRHHRDLGQQIVQPIITKPMLSTLGPGQSQNAIPRDHVSQHLNDSRPDLSTAAPEVPEARGMSETTASAVEGNILNFAIPSEPATSVMSMSVRKIEYPSPPPISKVMRGFKCPCCYQTLPEMFHDWARWRKHLTEDLCPYTCPFPECERAEVLYISRTAWRDHVLEAHGNGEYWECPACSGTDNQNTFSTAKELACHNHLKHGNAISDDEIADLQAFCRKMAPPSIMQCPLCPWPQEERVTPDAMTILEHVGSCIHEFSLYSLPWATSLYLEGAGSGNLSIPEVEEWLAGTVEQSNIEQIRNMDVTTFHPLLRRPRSPIQDPVHIPREYFAEISKDSSQAERGSRLSSGKWSEASNPQEPQSTHTHHAILIGVDTSTNRTGDDADPTAKSYPSRPSDRRGFEIAMICALTIEADAVEALFDHQWEDDGPPFGMEPGDPNTYSTGVIGRFNVVLAHMPGMGKLNAATAASHCRKSFPSIKLALMVGICGAVPFGPTKDEIILGDVIISNSVIQYDSGRQFLEYFVRKDMLMDVLGRPNLEILGVLAKLKRLRYRRQLSAKMGGYLDVLRQERELHAEYPGSKQDRLFRASYRHTDGQMSCEQLGCNSELVSRSRLSNADVSPMPAVHFGLMASGNAVIKSGEDRDRIASAEGIIAFEMGGAGVWDSFPCIIIKGACDYADSHKSNVWQRYAAATAAACAKAFLGFWTPALTLGSSWQASHGQTAISSQTQENTTSVSRRHYLPLSRNRNFTGRQGVIAQLQQLLFTDPDGQCVALVGLGGVGKTQVALQLAHLIKNNDQPGRSYNVIWMSALSMASFESACTEMISEFGVERLPKENPMDTFRRFLCSEKAGKWLLIIDNADNMETLYGPAEDPEGIAQFIPDCEHGYILFTTRSREVAVSVAKTNIVKLSEMDDQDAKALLQSSLIEKDQMQDTALINKLLHELAYLPLAITQASAYMKVNKVSVKEYLSLLQNTDQNMVELLSSGFSDGALAVATTWIDSFEQIRALDEDAATLLSFTAFLEPKAIPRALLPALGYEQTVTRAIGILCGYSFLSKRDDGETFDMHSLVHFATQRWNKDEGSETEIRRMAFAHIAKVFPSNDWENREVWRLYMPHALRLLASVDGADTKDRSKLGFSVGRCLLTDGRARQAVDILKSVVEIHMETLAKDDPFRLASTHELAMAYESNGRVEEAIELLEHVVAVQAETLPEGHPDRLRSQQELALACRSNGRVEEAVKLLEQVVTVQAETLPEGHPDRLRSQQELAIAYQSNGQIKEAIRLLEHVVTIGDNILAENHPDRLRSQHTLAIAYQSNGQIKEAIRLLEQVVTVQAETLPEGHPDRLRSQQELAIAYQSNGQIKEAIRLLEQVVTVQAETLHPDRQSSIYWLQHCFAILEEASFRGESEASDCDEDMLLA